MHLKCVNFIVLKLLSSSSPKKDLGGENNIEEKTGSHFQIWFYKQSVTVDLVDVEEDA
jgi:hypothetical protein